ncbi:MAG: hypothetical protein CME98_16910 [Hyphomonas sp.]|nr:hypothetical protein [Hyphomonas sp.]
MDLLKLLLQLQRLLHQFEIVVLRLRKAQNLQHLCLFQLLSPVLRDQKLIVLNLLVLLLVVELLVLMGQHLQL